jgi:hypothetical protein
MNMYFITLFIICACVSSLILILPVTSNIAFHVLLIINLRFYSFIIKENLFCVCVRDILGFICT